MDDDFGILPVGGFAFCRCLGGELAFEPLLREGGEVRFAGVDLQGEGVGGGSGGAGFGFGVLLGRLRGGVEGGAVEIGVDLERADVGQVAFEAGGDDGMGWRAAGFGLEGDGAFGEAKGVAFEGGGEALGLEFVASLPLEFFGGAFFEEEIVDGGGLGVEAGGGGEAA